MWTCPWRRRGRVPLGLSAARATAYLQDKYPEQGGLVGFICRYLESLHSHFVSHRQPWLVASGSEPISPGRLLPCPFSVERARESFIKLPPTPAPPCSPVLTRCFLLEKHPEASLAKAYELCTVCPLYCVFPDGPSLMLSPFTPFLCFLCSFFTSHTGFFLKFLRSARVFVALHFALAPLPRASPVHASLVSDLFPSYVTFSEKTSPEHPYHYPSRFFIT